MKSCPKSAGEYIVLYDYFSKPKQPRIFIHKSYLASGLALSAAP